ncbi:uncharacterized protein LOC142333169 isoform X2 [Lycorma delicatula]|uniref:uncharacterized protein LOC142333169 isoform X2 n=1 Tax=Lycorma delicatula TaxID=130591 RepID=UPI003F51960E
MMATKRDEPTTDSNVRISNTGEEVEELTSLEYEEDCYYAFVAKSETPSFDLEDPSWSDENDCMFVIVEEDFDEPTSLELDDLSSADVKNHNKPPGKNKFIRAIHVKFQDLSKPYLARVTNGKKYFRLLHLVKKGEEHATDMSPDSGINELAGLTPEEQEKQKQEWSAELAKVEEEIATLRHVLAAKVKISQELKRKLGFSVWKEFQDDMSQGIKNVKESNVYQNVEEKFGQFGRAVTEAPIYQKTESVIKTTAEKTTSLLGGIGSGLTTKLGQLKNSDSFRSFEEKVGSAYENTKVTTSRSNSMQSFEDAVREETNRKSAGLSPATTPTINEEQTS